jgi:hypothetical protein
MKQLYLASRSPSPLERDEVVPVKVPRPIAFGGKNMNLFRVSTMADANPVGEKEDEDDSVSAVCTVIFVPAHFVLAR